MNNTDISKFLSYVLRHQPESIGLTLDHEGWANIDSLITAAKQDGKSLTHTQILAVVASNDKKRFAISEDRLAIRAVQGHSTQSVDRSFPERIPPATLYHGTATRFLASIKAQGLISGSRQYVHLSDNIATAQSVGQRYGKPAILSIAAQDMHAQGVKFYQAENGVWLVDAVAVEFITA